MVSLSREIAMRAFSPSRYRFWFFQRFVFPTPLVVDVCLLVEDLECWCINPTLRTRHLLRQWWWPNSCLPIRRAHVVVGISCRWIQRQFLPSRLRRLRRNYLWFVISPYLFFDNKDEKIGRGYSYCVSECPKLWIHPHSLLLLLPNGFLRHYISYPSPFWRLFSSTIITNLGLKVKYLR